MMMMIMKRETKRRNKHQSKQVMHKRIAHHSLTNALPSPKQGLFPPRRRLLTALNREDPLVATLLQNS